MMGLLNRYRRWRDDRRWLRDIEEAEDVNGMLDDFKRHKLFDIEARGAARVRANGLRRGDRHSTHWRPEDVELACEVFFGDDWWDDRRVFDRRATFRTDMTDALNAAWEARPAPAATVVSAPRPPMGPREAGYRAAAEAGGMTPAQVDEGWARLLATDVRAEALMRGEA